MITKEEFTHYILEPFFEANFWSMNHITPTEQAYLYFMFGVMNTYLEEDLLDTPDKVQESWGWIESSIVENFEKTSRFVLQLQKKLSICQFGNDPFVFKGFWDKKEGGCFWKISRRQRFSAYISSDVSNHATVF
ncbi:hypothetical protein ODV99_05475 [Enterococcus faecium]|nr:hypothetical protein [Enterococcus faecium]